jgi:hypothetical protein
MGAIVPTFTDYPSECGTGPSTFLELLANCIVTYNGHQYLNILYSSASCDDMEDFETCGNPILDPDAALSGNLFALDECGRLGIKMLLNTGTGQ